MDAKTYVTEAIRTKSDRFYGPMKGYSQNPAAYLQQFNMDSAKVDVLHAIVGISTEGGELLDVVKKAMFYGKPIDFVNLDEEMGDVLWYVAVYCNARGVGIEELMQRNIDKLRVRYPEKFTQEQANTRDLAAERASLENPKYRPLTEDEKRYYDV